MKKIVWITNLSNLIIVAVVIVPMAIGGAPFYICWGIGSVIWMIGKSIDWIRYK